MSTRKCYLPLNHRSLCFLTLSNVNVPPQFLAPALLPSSLCAISSLQSTAGPPSLRPVSVLFHLACCYRGLDAGRLQLGSQSFSIYQHSPAPSLSTPFLLSWPHSLPSPASIQTQQFPTALTCPLPPSISSSFDQQRKFSSEALRQKKKEILWQWKRSS